MSFTRTLGTAAICALAVSGVIAGSDDGKLNFEQLTAENGFQAERHSVTTSDGYILQVWRIPGAQGDTSHGKPVVFMQHGIFDSAYCWMMNYPDVAPAFVAATAGYDVWLGNSRGNTYSEANIWLDPSDDEKEFWDFDWQDMGTKDLPAVIDYITGTTGQEKIAYVGHSQGTTQLYYGLAEMQSYFAKKLSVFVALGPVTKLPNTQSDLILFASHFYDLIADACDLFGIHSFLTANWFTTTATSLFCDYVTGLCELLMSFFTTSQTKWDDEDRFQVYMDHQPNGSSVKSLLHYAQDLKQDRFQIWAPDYNDLFPVRDTELIPIEDINTVPIAMFVGIDDILADPNDALWAANTIGDDVFHYQEINGGHLTFIVGKDMTWFTEDVMSILKEYQPLPAATEFLQ